MWRLLVDVFFCLGLIKGWSCNSYRMCAFFCLLYTCAFLSLNNKYILLTRLSGFLRGFYARSLIIATLNSCILCDDYHLKNNIFDNP